MVQIEKFISYKNLSKNNEIDGLNKILTKWRKLENSLSSSVLQKIKDAFRVYFIYEKNNQIIKIYSLRTLERNIPQKEFKVGECESLRDQLISEKIGNSFDEISKPIDFTLNKGNKVVTPLGTGVSKSNG